MWIFIFLVANAEEKSLWFIFFLQTERKGEVLFKWETYSKYRHMRETFYIAWKGREQQALKHNLIKKSASRLSNRNNFRNSSSSLESLQAAQKFHVVLFNY